MHTATSSEGYSVLLAYLYLGYCVWDLGMVKPYTRHYSADWCDPPGSVPGWWLTCHKMMTLRKRTRASLHECSSHTRPKMRQHGQPHDVDTGKGSCFSFASPSIHLISILCHEKRTLKYKIWWLLGDYQAKHILNFFVGSQDNKNSAAWKRQQHPEHRPIIEKLLAPKFIVISILFCVICSVVKQPINNVDDYLFCSPFRLFPRNMACNDNHACIERC